MTGIETGLGLDIVLWFQSWRTPLVEAIFLPFNYLGLKDFYIALLPLIYWCVDAAFGRRLSMLLPLSVWSRNVFKEWWKRPRPYHVSDAVRNVVDPGGYELPSGHTQDTTALWGVIAWRVRRRWVTILVVVYAALMGLSRVVLGAHYPQGVLAGWLIGLAWVGGYAWLEPRLSRWLAARGLWAQIGLVIGVAALALAIQPGLLAPDYPSTLNETVSALGVFLGAGIGFALEVRHVRFDARGVWWKRALRLGVGLAVVVGLRFGLKAALAGLGPDWVWRLVRYAVLGLWMALGAPWVFVKVGLAEGGRA